MKCPDCKSKTDVRRNGVWRCRRCLASGVTIDGRPHISSRYLSLSGERVPVSNDEHGKPTFGVRRGWRLNPWHPETQEMLTLIRARAGR